jgi:hypothetical protein
MTKRSRAWLAAAMLVLGGECGAADFEHRGWIQYEHYWYPSPQPNPVALDRNDAVALRLEGKWTVNERTSLGVQPFVRHDFRDPDRNASRFDELWVQYATPEWDVRLGPQLATWGSMESVSRVDVFNARDYQEDVVDPARIGTPAARLRLRRENSDLSVWYIPYYIPSEFPGQRSFYSVSGELPYTAARSRWENQWAARWFSAGGGFDIGLSYFRGVERTPLFSFDPGSGSVVATPYSSQRFGLETSRVFGSLIVKGELVYVLPTTPNVPKSTLYAAGLEYTLSSVWGHSDLTLFGEYLGTSGGPQQYQPLRNQVFIGTRWALNDQRKQRVEVGTVRDTKHRRSYLFRARYERDLTDRLSLGLTYTDTYGFFFDTERDEDESGAVRLFVRYNF